MREQLETLRAEAVAALETASTSAELEALRVGYLGKNGKLTAILKQMGGLSADERPVIGALANTVRGAIEQLLTSRQTVVAAVERAAQLQSETVDVTLPGRRREVGHRHPMSTLLDETMDIFVGMGFEIVDGPEVDTVYYNFDALNAPKNHPSRSLQDTFYFDATTLLRTQTSSVQSRYMESHKPPIRIISPGRTYRVDEADATHSPMFHQVEGLVVDKGITMGDLKGTLALLFKRLYGDNAEVRFRPHYFPFTEPSAEMDLKCFACDGDGCRMCKGEGWIEMLGCGMVHPNVLRIAGIDPEVYSGFAFGVGTDRMTMWRFGINSMRLCFDNDLRFLKQF